MKQRALEIPETWETVQVKELVRNISLSGKKLKKGDYHPKGLLPVIDQGQDLIGGYTDEEALRVECELPVVVFGDHTRAFKYIDFNFVAGADGIKVLQLYRVYYPKLFYYFVRAIRLPDKGYARHYQYLAKSEIPIPPRKEQHRIVEKIEELFSDLDAGVAALRQVRKQLQRYRQAVLKAAVEGTLTEAWRTQHGPYREDAGVLLERILEERRRIWEAEELAKYEAKGKTPPKGWQQRYKEPAAPDTADLPDLPDGWVWASSDMLFEYVTSGSRGWSKYYADSGVLFIRMGNLSHDTIDLDVNDAQRVDLPENVEGLHISEQSEH